MNAMGMSPGRTFPVEQLFLEDILDKTDYVIEENSLNTRKMKKFGGPGDTASLECELAVADIQASRTVIQNPAIRDEDLTISQLYYRYKGKFSNVTLFMQKSMLTSSHVILLEVRELNDVTCCEERG
jgi:ATP-dependent RNA helicase DHX57